MTWKVLLESLFIHDCLLPLNMCFGDEEKSLPKIKVRASNVNLLSSSSGDLLSATSAWTRGTDCAVHMMPPLGLLNNRMSLSSKCSKAKSRHYQNT